MSLHPELLALLASAKRGGMVEKLALADWLEEHGEPDRASVIRLQMEMTDLDEDEEPYRDNEGSVHRLEERHRQDWFGWTRTCTSELARFYGVHRDGLLFLQLGDGFRVLELLAAKEEFAWVTGLGFRDLGSERARALFQSSHLTNLTHLDLSDNRLERGDIMILRNSPHLANLTHLDLSDNRIRADGVYRLAGSPHLANLTHLNLANASLADPGAEILAQSPKFANLRSLNVVGNLIADGGARALAESPHLANLTRLDLRSNEIGNEVQQLLRDRFGANVRFEDW